MEARARLTTQQELLVYHHDAKPGTLKKADNPQIIENLQNMILNLREEKALLDKELGNAKAMLKK